ncbi:MAG: DinB family protein [Geminicoccaceae bacterium]
MACNNAWANHRLLEACERLPPGALEAPRSGFFPSLHRTLNHLLYVDWYYVDALEGGSLGPAAWADEIPCPALADLRREQAAVDRRLIAVCAALTPETLGREVRLIRPKGLQRERADRVLLHLFQHQVHHRGQAHAMLSATSVAPPQLDEFFLADEAPLRAAELAELGLDETTVWLLPRA